MIVNQACRLCGAATNQLLDFGSQPFSNRFLESPADSEAVFRLAVASCGHCGLVQLCDPPPADALRPRVDWIRYNEPEGHLDQVADWIRTVDAGRANPLVVGLTYKDASLVERLRGRGCPRGTVLALEDFGATEEHAGIETVQAALTPDVARRLRRQRGPADVIVARHILEHAQDQRALLAAFRSLLAPDGMLVLEVPDASRSLAGLDYSTIWEEHVVYFTALHLRAAIEAAGFTSVEIRTYQYPLEDSLVLVCRRDAAAPDGTVACGTREDWSEPRALASGYGAGFPGRRAEIAATLERERRQGRRIAMFGAGHLCVKFVNLMQVSGWIDFVVDDHPRKKGLFLPGARLPVVGSECLLADDGPDLCLSSLSPESEDRVLSRLQGFLARGGRFASIFPASSRAYQGGRHVADA